MTNYATLLKAELEQFFSLAEILNNVQIWKDDKLPNQTMIVSSDLFELLKQLNSEKK
jgi:hypothetical protein